MPIRLGGGERELQPIGSMIQELALAAQDGRRVQGATHKFYPYPARFSPHFVQAAIERFTAPGDLIFDPFVGGGTTLVEALRLGRDSVGFDINELGIFVSQTKTTVLTFIQEQSLRTWAAGLHHYINMLAPAGEDKDRRDGGYFRHLETGGLWRYRKAIQQALDAISWLPLGPCQQFARCALLRTAQTALDGKRNPPSIPVFRKRFAQNLFSMLDDMAALRAETGNEPRSTCEVLKRSAASSHECEAFSLRKPKLILTSPPYPGVHVLYHRWQIGGRKETAAPYWIANKLDGDGERYYTLGHRQEKGLKTYFSNLEASFRSIAQVCDEETTIVQVVAFSSPDWQLEEYLSSLNRAGLKELPTGSPDRLWRDVPNRRWHAQAQANQSSSKEVVLFHKIS